MLEKMQTHTLDARIFVSLINAEKGMSSRDLFKVFERAEDEQRIGARLRHYQNLGVLKRKETKFRISRPVFAVNGSIFLLVDKDWIPQILNCPYFNNGCTCQGILTKDCKFINEDIKNKAKPLYVAIKKCGF